MCTFERKINQKIHTNVIFDGKNGIVFWKKDAKVIMRFGRNYSNESAHTHTHRKNLTTTAKKKKEKERESKECTCELNFNDIR